MTGLQWVVSSTGLLLLGTLLLGLFVRGRHRICSSFTAYVIVSIVTAILPTVDPEHFYTWAFWLIRDSILAALKLGIALQLARPTFRSFPGALARARGVMLLVLSVFLVAVLLVPTGPEDSESFYPKLLPRVQNGTAWLFTAILGIVLWYRLPLNLFRKAILVGFVPMLLVSTLAVQVIATWGAKFLIWGVHLRVYAGYGESLAYDLAVAYWTYSAWRPVIPTVPDDPGRGGLEGWLKSS